MTRCAHQLILVVLAITFGLSKCALVYAQPQNWQPVDSVVQIYHMKDDTDLLFGMGWVAAVEGKKAFILCRVPLPREYPTELSPTALSAMSEWNIVVKPGELDAEMIPANLPDLMQPQGFPRLIPTGLMVLVADASKLPPPLVIEDTQHWTEGMAVNGLVFKSAFGQKGWRTEKAEKQLTVAKIAGSSVQLQAASGELDRASTVITDGQGNCFGVYSFRSMKTSGLTLKKLSLNRDPSRVIQRIPDVVMAKPSMKQIFWDGKKAKFRVVVKALSLKRPLKQVDIHYQIAPRSAIGLLRDEFSKRHKVHRAKLDAGVAKSGNLTYTGLIELEIDEEEVRPNSHLVRSVLFSKPSDMKTSRSWSSVVFRPILMTESLSPPTASGDASMKPVLLTKPDTKVAPLSNDPAYWSIESTRGSFSKEPWSQTAVVPGFHIVAKRGHLVLPVVASSDQRMVALATDRGEVGILDVDTMKFRDQLVWVRNGVAAVGWFAGDLLVLTGDGRNLLRFDAKSWKLLAEISLPHLLGRVYQPGEFVCSLAFMTNEPIGFVQIGSSLVSVDLSDNTAKHLITIGQTAPYAASRRSQVTYYPRPRISRNGKWLIVQNETGYQRIRIDRNQLTMDKSYRKSSSGKQIALFDDSFVTATVSNVKSSRDLELERISLDTFQPTDKINLAGYGESARAAGLCRIGENKLACIDEQESGSAITIFDFDGKLIRRIEIGRPVTPRSLYNFFDEMTYLAPSGKLVCSYKRDRRNQMLILNVKDDDAGRQNNNKASEHLATKQIGATTPSDIGQIIEFETMFSDIVWPPVWSKDSSFVLFPKRDRKIYRLDLSSHEMITRDFGSISGKLKRIGDTFLAPLTSRNAVVAMDEKLNVIKEFYVPMPYYIASRCDDKRFVVGSANVPEDRKKMSTGSKDIVSMTLFHLDTGEIAKRKKMGIQQPQVKLLDPNMRELVYQGGPRQLIMSTDGTFVMGVGRKGLFHYKLDDSFELAQVSKALPLINTKATPPCLVGQAVNPIDAQPFEAIKRLNGPVMDEHPLQIPREFLPKLEWSAGLDAKSRKLLDNGYFIYSLRYCAAWKAFLVDCGSTFYIIDQNGKQRAEVQFKSKEKRNTYGNARALTSVSPDGKLILVYFENKLMMIKDLSF